jgi:NAD+ synthase (glutamine-hydrolysing)
MKVLVAQTNPTVADRPHNLEQIEKALKSARSQKADLVVFPVGAIFGPVVGDIFFHSDVKNLQEEMVQTILPMTKGICAVFWVIKNGAVTILLLRNGEEIPILAGDILTISSKKVIFCLETAPYCQNFVDLIVVAGVFPWSMGDFERRAKWLSTMAVKHKTQVLFINQVGGNDSLIFDGGSALFDSSGRCEREAPRFCEYSGFLGSPTKEPLLPLEELYKALLLGISDFFRKQKVQKCIVGTSGGIDSSLVVTLATAALGKDHVEAILLPHRYTSKESVEGAIMLSQNLGIRHRTIPIDDSVDLIEQSLTRAGISLERVALGNIQSRIRAVVLMAIANSEHALVLATGNKSEGAIGYATLYGDICGALSPVGDLFKLQIFELARWINRNGPLIPESIVQREPTAELHPGQKDSDDLPSYSALDPVLEAIVMKGNSVKEISLQTGMDAHLVHWIHQKMWASEFKRRQSPRVLKVSQRAFGCDITYPIANAMSRP